MVFDSFKSAIFKTLIKYQKAIATCSKEKKGKNEKEKEKENVAMKEGTARVPRLLDRV